MLHIFTIQKVIKFQQMLLYMLVSKLYFNLVCKYQQNVFSRSLSGQYCALPVSFFKLGGCKVLPAVLPLAWLSLGRLFWPLPSPHFVPARTLCVSSVSHLLFYPHSFLQGWYRWAFTFQLSEEALCQVRVSCLHHKQSVCPRRPVSCR